MGIPSYDCVIIGGGLAGLSCAWHLRDLKTCVLEKDERLGGRVMTRERMGVAYELGAVFGYDPALAPPGSDSSPRIAGTGPVGLYRAGGLHLGDSVFTCIRNSDPGEEDWSRMMKFYVDEIDGRSLPVSAAATLNAFFRVIHPGDLRDYCARRQRDAFTRFDIDHYAGGNGELVEAFQEGMTSNVRTGVKVLSVIDHGFFVEVIFRDGNEESVYRSAAAVVTAPGPLAGEMIVYRNPRSSDLLYSVRYGPGIVAVLALPDRCLADFSYIVAEGLPVNTLIRSSSGTEDITLIYAYFVAEEARRIGPMPDERIVARALECVNLCGAGTVTGRDVLFSDVKRWDMVGPLITPEVYGDWDEEARRPSERVFLAGDYVFVDPADPMPYGMAAAVLSGKRAAEDVLKYLE